MKMKSDLKNKKVPKDWMKPVEYKKGSFEDAKEIARKQTKKGGDMPKRIINPIRKTLSSLAGLLGVGSVGSLLSGSVVTSDPVMDGALLLMALLIIILNGKKGVPDWLIELIKGRLTKKKR